MPQLITLIFQFIPIGLTGVVVLHVVMEPQHGRELALVESVLVPQKRILLKLLLVMKEDVSILHFMPKSVSYIHFKGLSLWSAWSGCAGSVCGEGTKSRYRSCTDGLPGDDCDGAILIEDNVSCTYQCPQHEFVMATCGSTSTSEDINGGYAPIGSKNNGVLYKKSKFDQNGLTWYMHLDVSQQNWVFSSSATPWSSIDDFNSDLLGE